MSTITPSIALLVLAYTSVVGGYSLAELIEVAS